MRANPQGGAGRASLTVCIDGRYIQDHFPGIGRYTYNLIDALARVAPDDAFVVLHNPALRNARYDVAELARHPNLRLRETNAPTFSLAEQYRLLSDIADAASGPARLFHTPYYIMPYRIRIPSVVSIFDLIPLKAPNVSPGLKARLMFRLTVSLAVRSAVRVIVPSAATQADLHAALGVPCDKLAVVPLAADRRFRPQPPAEIARVRAKYALPALYILTVGINKPHKNLGVLIQAWRRAADPGCALVIAGAWDSRYALAVPPAGVGQPELRFLRDVPEDDLPALYGGAELFAFPSLYEGFGFPPLEAMACGSPVVCSNSSSLPEVVGDAALLVNPREPGEMAGAIRRVLGDASLRERMARQSLDRAAHFSWERTARETMSVYQDVAEGLRG